MNASSITSHPIPAVAVIFLAFVLLEVALGSFRQTRAQRRDHLIEVVGSSLLLAVTFPLVTLLAHAALGALAPQSRGALAGIPWLAGFGLFLVLDDLMQYGWHRLSHSVPWLFDLHRAHHSAPYMSVRIVYRNNSLYYLLMPNLWLSAALIYLGLAHVYFVYMIIKMTVIIGAHSSVPWDDRLYRVRALRPLMWLLERTISTPSTHSAHHGLSAADGVTHYKGNFGNLLFFWDVLFRTAQITRRRPEQFGIEDLPPVTWQHELFWPFAREGTVANAPAVEAGTTAAVES